MPKSIDEAAQARRRRDARISAMVSSGWMLLTGCILLWLRWQYVPEGFWSSILLLSAVLELGMIIPIWILLKKRLKEIEGGEEDAAAQY